MTEISHRTTTAAADPAVRTGSDEDQRRPVTDAEPCWCSHPFSEHDAIASRYCAATMSAGLTRGCICRVAPRKPYV